MKGLSGVVDSGSSNMIAEAVGMDIPVLVGLNALNRSAFKTFEEGLAIELPPDPNALMAWVKEVAATVDVETDLQVGRVKLSAVPTAHSAN